MLCGCRSQSEVYAVIRLLRTMSEVAERGWLARIEVRLVDPDLAPRIAGRGSGRFYAGIATTSILAAKRRLRDSFIGVLLD